MYFCRTCINFLLLLNVICLSDQQTLSAIQTARKNHRARQLTDIQLQKTIPLGNTTQFRSVLDPILIPRVVGTEGHEKVKQYLVKYMQSLDWDVELDTFTSQTPIGPLQFDNVVARLDPQASRFLVVACHYDSKLMDNFVGATDSAVPCAMMLHIASVLAGPLKKSATQDVSLKFIFFDGEEAFVEWGPNDSIYGAKHLAQKLQSSLYAPNSKSNINGIDRMDMLILLDLIGVSNPKFYSYFRDTRKWYLTLANAEQRLAARGLLARRSRNTYFLQFSSFAGTEDDHIPFLQRGVPIMHLIPSPFPSVWHTSRDNLSALDFNTIGDLNKILSVFIAEYLKLEI